MLRELPFLSGHLSVHLKPYSGSLHFAFLHFCVQLKILLSIDISLANLFTQCLQEHSPLKNQKAILWAPTQER